MAQLKTNDGYVYREILQEDAAGQRLIDWLCDRYRHSSRETWMARLAAQELWLDGKLAQAGDRLRPGQGLRWHREPWFEEPVPTDFQIVHEDEDLLVVSKPSGLPTMPAGGFFRNTLWALVQERFPEAFPAHRLGRGTSGLVLFGRNARARAALAASFRRREIRRIYLAIIQGRPRWRSSRIETPIGPVPHSKLRSVHAASSAGKSARSEVRLIQVGEDSSVVEVEIHTGRPHQIRIHLASVGHPLLGDPLYEAGGLPRPEALPGDGGYHLHAARVEVRHPGSGRFLRLEAPLPEAFSGYL